MNHPTKRRDMRGHREATLQIMMKERIIKGGMNKKGLNQVMSSFARRFIYLGLLFQGSY